MQQVYNRLGLRLGFDRENKPDEAQMLRAISVLIAVRFRLIHERTLFAMQRKKLKGEMKRFATGKLYDNFDPLSLFDEPIP